MKNKINKAFSIIELSVVILIIAIMSTTSMSLFSSRSEIEKIQSTKKKIELIYEATKTFVKINKRIPCPADPKLNESNIAFGTEGDCNTTYYCDSDQGDDLPDVCQGAVPVYALGLSNDMIKDDFNYKFSYIIIKGHHTEFNYSNIGEPIDTIAEDSFEYTAGEEEAIELIYGKNDYKEYPALLIISHGKNGHGAYSYGGNEEDNTPQTFGNLENEEQNYAFTTDGNNNFIINITNQFYYNDSGEFDNIVFFKNKETLIMDIDWEDKLCINPLCIDNLSSTYEETENLNSANCINNNPNNQQYIINTISKAGTTVTINKYPAETASETAAITCDDPTEFRYETTCGKYGIWSKYAIQKNCDASGNYIIAMWSGDGNDLPDDWSICDGADGKPDLRNRFIVGAGIDEPEEGIIDENDKYSSVQDDPANQNDPVVNDCDTTNTMSMCYKVGEEGGKDTHKLAGNESGTGAHNHTYDKPSATTNSVGTVGSTITTTTIAPATTTDATPQDANLAHENRPPYYALYFICKKL